MQQTDFTFSTQDNITLFARSWTPPAAPRAIVCLVHGIGEHSDRYEPLARAMTDRSIILTAFDMRGHGRSEGKRGHTPSYAAWMGDIARFLSEVRNRFPTEHYFLYGHSLGGNLVLNYGLRENPFLSGIIASSPELDLAFRPNRLSVAASRVLNVLWPSLTLATRLERTALSRDPYIVASYQEDPLVHDRISSRTYWSFMKAGAWAIANAHRLTIPTLLMHGSSDRITSSEASREFARRAGAQVCTFRLWEGYYHELHNDIGKEAIIGFILQWIEEHAK